MCDTPTTTRRLHEAACFSVGAHPSWGCGLPSFPVREGWRTGGWREPPYPPEVATSLPHLGGGGEQLEEEEGGRRRHVYGTTPVKGLGWWGGAPGTPGAPYTWRVFEAMEAELRPPLKRRRRNSYSYCELTRYIQFAIANCPYYECH